MNKIKIAIIEKEHLMRECLAQMIEKQHDFEVHGHWGSSEAAWPHLATDAADIILLSTSGRSDELNKILPYPRGPVNQTPIMILTSQPNLSELVQGFNQGATGYISKQAATGTFFDALREVRNGKAFVDIEIREALVSLYLQRWRAGDSGKPVAFTPREQQLLLLLAQGHSTMDAASRLGLSHKTVAIYKFRVKTKLSICDDADLVRYAATQVLLPAELLVARESRTQHGLTLVEN